MRSKEKSSAFSRQLSERVKGYVLCALVLLFPMMLYANSVKVEDSFLFKESTFRAHFQSRSNNINWETHPGVPDEIGKKLNAYQADPSMANAIHLLQHYNEMGTNPNLRKDLFQADPVLFQSLDIAKFDLIMQVQKDMHENKNLKIGHVLRVGSTAQRLDDLIRVWGSNFDITVLLDPNGILALNSDDSSKKYKPFASDDDVTLLPPIDANSFEAAELLNGGAFTREFVEYTKRKFGVAFNPSLAASVEALSPTDAYLILRQQFPDIDNNMPNFIQAFISSNGEKYNGLFAVEQLKQWAMSKGWVTLDVSNPTTSTRKFSDAVSDPAQGLRGPEGYPGDDLFGWMTNQHRQIFVTHARDLQKGELKYIRKYIQRMVIAWADANETAPNPEGHPSLPLDADGRINPEGLSDLVNGMNEASLKAYISDIMNESHQLLVDSITETIKKTIQDRSRVAPSNSDGAPILNLDLDALKRINPKLEKQLNALAVAYTNIDPDLQKKLDDQLQLRIDIMEAASTADTDYFRGDVARYLKAAKKSVDDATQSTRNNIAAFRQLREVLGERINDHLVALGSKNLDAYLLKVAEGKMVRSELHARWDDNSSSFIRRQLDPVDVAEDLKAIEHYGSLFGWSDAIHARFVKDYFNEEPGIAVQMMVDLHRLTAADRFRNPRTVYYSDVNGIQQVKTIQRSQMDVRMSIGLLALKGSAKAGRSMWDLSGKASDGKTIYKSMKTLFWDNSRVSEDRLQAYGQTMTALIGLSDMVEWFGGTQPLVLARAGGSFSASVSVATDPFSNQAWSSFATAISRDLISAFAPQYATALLMMDMGVWAYQKYDLSQSQGDLVKLLVENGEWEVDDTGKKDPKLLGYREKPNGLLIQDMNKLAKVLSDDLVGGIMLVKSKYRVDPRKELIDLAKGKAILSKDARLITTLDAADELMKPSGFYSGFGIRTGWSGGFILPSKEVSEITSKRLEAEFGIKPPTKEDDRKYTRGKIFLTQAAADGSFSGDVKDGVKKNFGYLVSQYWVRRQILLEDVVLKEILKAAVNAKQKEELATKDPTLNLAEIEELDKRMEDLDKRVWSEVAKSAAPFSGDLYDQQKGFPIRDSFKSATAYYRSELTRYMEALKDPSALTQADFGDGVGPPSDPAALEAVIDQHIVELMENIVNTMQKYESEYGLVFKEFLTTNKLVKKADGYDVHKYHASLTGQPSNKSTFTIGDEGDVERVKAWSKIFIDQQSKVAVDVVVKMDELGLAVRPPKTVGGASKEEIAMAQSHPHFGYLLRLQFQISKLGQMNSNLAKLLPIELLDYTSEMQQDRLPVSLQGDISTPLARGERIQELINEMSGEYYLLLDQLDQLFVLTLDTKAKDQIKLLDKIDPELNWSADPVSGLEDDELDKFINHIRWTLTDINSGSSFSEKGKTTEPTWEYVPNSRGRFLLTAELISAQDVVLAEAEAPLSVFPAELSGQVTVNGSLPENTDIRIYLGDVFQGLSGGAGGFSIPLDQVSDSVLIKLGLRKAITRSSKKLESHALSQVNGVDDKKSNASELSASPGLLRVNDPLVLNYGPGVLINVLVTEASGLKVSDADVTVSSGSASSATPDALFLPLQNGDVIQAQATRDEPSPGVTSPSVSLSYDPSTGLDPSITLVLPYFEIGQMDISGYFESAPSNPNPVSVVGGRLWGNATDNVDVREDGHFSFKNEKQVILAGGLLINASLKDKEDKLIRPVQRPFPHPLRPGSTFSIGPIPVEPYTVDLDPIIVEVRDWTGQGLKSVDLSIGDQTANPTSAFGDFEGSWSFTKYGEKVQLVASVAVPGTGDIKESHEISIDEIKDHDAPSLPGPIAIKMPVYAPYTLSLIGGIRFNETFDNPADKPQFVDLTFSIDGGAKNVATDTDYYYDITSLAVIGQEIVISGEATEAGKTYRGETRIGVNDKETTLRPPTLILSTTGAQAGSSLDTILAEIQRIAGPFEQSRDEAIAKCNYEKAAQDQEKILSAAQDFVSRAFTTTAAPPNIQNILDRFRQDYAALKKTADAERLVKDHLRNAQGELRVKPYPDMELAMDHLEDAINTPDVASCLRDRVLDLYNRLEADLLKLKDEIDKVMAQVNQCEFEKAALLAEPIAKSSPKLSWVQTEYPKIKERAKNQREVLGLLREANDIAKEAEAKATTDPKAGVLRYNQAIRKAEQALKITPTCDEDKVQRFLDVLISKAKAVASGAPPAAANSNIDRVLLLVIDASGSMGNNSKMQHAKSAAVQTAQSLGPNVAAGLVSYSGGCGGFRMVHDFSTDKAGLVQAIQGLSPGGGTPMAPAVGFAQSQLEAFAQSVGVSNGQLILLSDGQNDCGNMQSAGEGVRKSPINIRVDAVGLGLGKGSQAEQDLTTLVRASGGQQYSAGNSEELIRAFRRASIRDQIKDVDSNDDPKIQTSLRQLFNEAIAYLDQGNYSGARLTFQKAYQQHPKSPSANYNLSLAYEAEGQLISAIDHAEKYLDLAPNALDGGSVRTRLDNLRREQAQNPRAIFNPAQCNDLYQWARSRASAIGNATQKAKVYSIMNAAQRGDCPSANSAYEKYTTEYGN